MSVIVEQVNVYQWFLLVSFSTSQNRVLIWYGRLDQFFFKFKAKPIFQWVWNNTFLFLLNRNRYFLTFLAHPIRDERVVPMLISFTSKYFNHLYKPLQTYCIFSLLSTLVHVTWYSNVYKPYNSQIWKFYIIVFVQYLFTSLKVVWNFIV